MDIFSGQAAMISVKIRMRTRRTIEKRKPKNPRKSLDWGLTYKWIMSRVTCPILRIVVFGAQKACMGLQLLGILRFLILRLKSMFRSEFETDQKLYYSLFFAHIQFFCSCSDLSFQILELILCIECSLKIFRYCRFFFC